MKNQNQVKSLHLKARISPEELEMINKYIEKNGLKNRSNLIREFIVERIKKEMEESK